MARTRIFFRVTPLTRLTFPILLNAWKRAGFDTRFPPRIVEGPPPAERGDLVLYSFLTVQLPELHAEITALCKKGVILVAGGPHADAEADLTARLGFHVRVTGDGERAITELGRRLLDSPHDLPKVIHGGRTADFSAWLPLSDHMKTLPPIEMMRGCARNCAYCATGRISRPRFRSLSSTREYMQQLGTRDVKRINFISPCALAYRAPEFPDSPRESVHALLQSAHKAGFQHIEYGIFPSEIRPEALDREWLALLRKYVSNRRITLGAQSGVNQRLRAIRRGHTRECVQQAVALANELGFTVNLDFIVGYPDESPEELRATTEFIRAIHAAFRVHAQVHHFFPLPGTGLGNRLPTFHAEPEIHLLDRLHRDGLITRQWQINRAEAIRYLEWLQRHFPDLYARFK